MNIVISKYFKVRNYSWSSFTYIFRKRYYRLRLFLRFMKYEYYGAWEMIEPMIEIPFEIFCEFYEHSGLKDKINYSESPWKEAVEEMDFLYNWWNIIYDQRQEEINYLLHVWSEHFVSWIEPFKENEDFTEWKSQSTRYAEYLSDMLHKEEEKFEKEKEEALIRLIKIRNYLWD